MGGELQACGCFDGPLSADDPSLVSVRCDEHYEQGNLHGYKLMRLGKKGRPYAPVRRRREKRAIPKSKGHR